MKCIVLIVGLILLSVRTRDAWGQTSVRFDYPLDSVLALRPGTSNSANLIVYPYISPYCYGLSAYSVTLQFDAAQLQAPSAQPVLSSGFPAPTVTNNPGSLNLAGTGANSGCPVAIARLTFTLDPAATQGSIVSIQALTLTSYYYSYDLLPYTSTVPLRICHATKIWGDLDLNGSPTTRDALIALSSAVGLSIAGFDSSVGDVDRDGLITSRDALFILSAAIGNGGGSRVGHGIADACPTPPVAPPAYLSKPRVTAGADIR